ncbi:helix-turn-helix domain-containing protein [Tumebacillus flagellatus]|nr:helix-turn-helix transcriptional regulator [Tumebacillus flagellatus]
MAIIGERIKELRIARNMTQVELSEGLCTSSMISQIESGKARPSYQMLSEIADRLQVSMEYFVEDSKPNQEYTTACRAAKMAVAGRNYTQAAELIQLLLNSQKSQQDAVPLLLDLLVCYLELGKRDLAVRLIEMLEREAKQNDEYAMLARMHQHRGTLHAQARDFRKAALEIQRALDTLAHVEKPDPHVHARLLFQLAEAQAKLGRTEEALALSARSTAYFKHARKISDQAHTCLQLAKSASEHAQHRQAILFAERARHLSDVVRQRVEGERCRMGRALWFARNRSSSEEARNLLQETVRRLHKLGNLEEAGLAALQLARLHLQADDVPAAEAARAQAERWIPAAHPARRQLQALQGRLDGKNRRFRQGKRLLQEVADHFYDHRRLFEWEEAVSDLAGVYAEEENYRKASRLLLQARQQNRGVLFERGVCL